MPRKDNFHETVKIALKKQDWEITNDPLFVPTKGNFNFFIDLGAERIIGAEKNSEQIAIEVKSFSESSPMYTFYEILGQFLVYNIALQEQIKPWDLFIAISTMGFKRLNDSPIFAKAIEQYQLKFIIINANSQSVVKWKN